MSIYAVVKTLDAGYPQESIDFKSLGFKVGDKFLVDSIDVGQSSSSVYLKEIPHKSFNSVFFSFEENGKVLNIYSDERFNMYKNIWR